MRFVIAVTLIVLAMSAARAASPEEQRGLTFAQANCSLCHAIGRHGESPLAIAPPFRELHQRYELDLLAQRMANGTISDHPTMPQFLFDAAQVADLIAYLRSLAPARQ